MDKALSDAEIETIYTAAMAIAGVKGVHDLRARTSGGKYFVQLHIELSSELNIVMAHAIADQVNHAVKALWDDVDIIVYQDPINNNEQPKTDRNQLNQLAG